MHFIVLMFSVLSTIMTSSLYDDIVKACIDATPTSCQGLTNTRQKKKNQVGMILSEIYTRKRCSGTHYGKAQDHLLWELVLT